MNSTFSTLPGAKKIGNYIISKNLGQGTFGKVKLGIHSLTEEKVAIKILQKSKISDVSDVERVTRQIQILKQVRHPNIIQLYEIIQTPKQLFLIMEYVSEGELFDHIVKRKRLKQIQACEYFRQIIAAIQYLHELGIVHRDLKPENLLIDFNRRIKLVDFGLSNTYKQKQLLKTACGSPCYAAPEMISGKKYEGLMADIWSCGIILFAMVCGYLPFEDPNTSLLYKKIISGEFTIPKYISPLCKQFIRGLLTTDPHRRLTIKQIKQHEWFKQIRGNQFYNIERPPIGIKVSQHLIPIDESIVEEIKQYENKIDFGEVKKMIANNRHNHIVTVYYLLLKRNLKVGVDSAFDICSPVFDEKLLKPKEAGAEVGDRNKYKSVSKYDRDSSKESREGSRLSDNVNKTIDEVDLRTTTTSNGFRIGSRTINRANFNCSSEKNSEQNGQRNLQQTARNPKNNYIDKLSNLKNAQQLADLADVDNLVKLNQRRRKLNIQNTHRTKRQELIDLYGGEEVFRNTLYVPKPANKSNERTTTISPNTRIPISFRTSLQRYKNKIENPKQDRFLSLDITENQLQTKQQTKDTEKSKMNKTFMGKFNNMPKYPDSSENQRLRHILNKTITRQGSRSGSRKKKRQLSVQYY